MAKLLKGIAPALITPFRAEGEGVDVDVVDQLVKFHLDAGVHGFYLCGNTGEGFNASVQERKDMTAAVMAAMERYGKKIPVIVMVAALDINDAIALAKHAESVGADAISSGTALTIMSFFNGKQKGLLSLTRCPATLSMTL
eukprot:m.214250 g.214250  ORF g.214250 m.214250 type:complete len:141 (-) comp15100_c4_seq1:1074-1496(-)